MMEPMAETIRFDHSSGGTYWILADLGRGTLAWHGGDGACALSSDEVARLRALAASVRAEDAALQPTHVTYAQDESLVLLRGSERVVIEANNGEICTGPPGALLEAMRALVDARR
jgi:hypothetical protein